VPTTLVTETERRRYEMPPKGHETHPSQDTLISGLSVPFMAQKWRLAPVWLQARHIINGSPHRHEARRIARLRTRSDVAGSHGETMTQLRARRGISVETGRQNPQPYPGSRQTRVAETDLEIDFLRPARLIAPQLPSIPSHARRKTMLG
jgi:hypothetical protein